MNLVVDKLRLLSHSERNRWEIWPLPGRRISRPRNPSTWRTERRTSWRRRWRGGRGWWWRWYSPGRHRGDWLARPLAERGRNRAEVSSAELRSSGVTPAWCLLPPRTQSSRAWRDSPRRICRPPGTKCRRWWSACPLHRILMEALLVLHHYILTVASLVVCSKAGATISFQCTNFTERRHYLNIFNKINYSKETSGSKKCEICRTFSHKWRKSMRDIGGHWTPSIVLTLWRRLWISVNNRMNN